jgi:hypothetical protein
VSINLNNTTNTIEIDSFGTVNGSTGLLLSTTNGPIQLNPGGDNGVQIENDFWPRASGVDGDCLRAAGSGVLKWVPGIEAVTMSKTLYVSATGNDTTGDGSMSNPWATVPRALAWLKNRWINSDVKVTIQVGDGAFGHSSALVLSHPCLSRIEIVGTNTYTQSFSLVSITNIGGQFSAVLSLPSVANVAVGDYVRLTGTTGSFSELLRGCHYVSNVDTGNNQITVLTKSKNTTRIPGVGCSGTALIFKTKLTFNGTNGVTVYEGGSLAKLDKVVVVGSGTTDTAGILCGQGPAGETGSGTINCGSYVCVVNFAVGVAAWYGGSIYAQYITSSGNTVDGIRGQMGGKIDATYGIATGNGGSGVVGMTASLVRFTSGTSAGNAIHGVVFFLSAGLEGTNSVLIGNLQHGAMIYSASAAYMENVNSCYNGQDGLNCTYGSTIVAANAVATNNGWNGIHASQVSNIYANPSTVNNNGNYGWFAEDGALIRRDASGTPTGNGQAAQYAPKNGSAPYTPATGRNGAWII